MNTIAAIILCVVLTPDSSAETKTTDSPQNTIRAVLTDQSKAWNRGDIDSFMKTYWRSEKLSFSSGGQTTRGWQATSDRYHKRYPTRAAMGQLKFDQLEVTSLGEHSAMVLGRWHLQRKKDGKSDDIGGNFTLILRLIDGKWKIIHDHTSKAE